MRPRVPQDRLISTGRESAFSGSGIKERIWYSFYDRQTFANGNTTEKAYFTTVNNDDMVGNFEGNSQMPAGQAFHVHALRIVPKPGSRADDVNNFLLNSRLLFTIENAKRYSMGMSWLFPGGVGTVVETVPGAGAAAAPANAIGIGHNGIPSLGNRYDLRIPVPLRPQQNFRIGINTPSGVTLSASLDVYVVMTGVLERNVQ